MIDKEHISVRVKEGTKEKYQILANDSDSRTPAHFYRKALEAYVSDETPRKPKSPKKPAEKKGKFDALSQTTIDHVLSIGIDSQVWIEWAKFRASKKKPISNEAANKQVKLLAKYTHEQQRQMVDSSISNDYQGLFEPKPQGGRSAPQAFKPVHEHQQGFLDNLKNQASIIEGEIDERP